MLVNSFKFLSADESLGERRALAEEVEGKGQDMKVGKADGGGTMPDRPGAFSWTSVLFTGVPIRGEVWILNDFSG